MEFSPKEQALVSKLGFDADIVIQIKMVSQAGLREWAAPTTGAILTEAPAVAARGLVLDLRARLHNRGYAAYLVATPATPLDWSRLLGMPVEQAPTDRALIAILKDADPLMIVQLQQTNGANYAIGTERLVRELKSWRKFAPYELVGAGFSWLDLEFRKLPADTLGFVEYLYELCPNIADSLPSRMMPAEEAGWDEEDDPTNGLSLEAVADWLAAERRLFLWWD